MGFADARRTKQQEVVAAFKPAFVLTQLHDGGLMDTRTPAEVKIGKGFGRRQVGIFEGALDSSLVALRRFDLTQCQ